MSPPISPSTSEGGRPTGERAARTYPRASAQTPVCPLCGGTGFVVSDVPVGHPEFGKAIPCSCREAERRVHRQRVLQQLGALDTLARFIFETFTPEPGHLPADKAANLRLAYETCVRYAHNPEGWLLLTGTYGCGKTHLAASIANERLARGQPAIFMVVPDLLDHLRAAFGPNSEATYDTLFDQLRNAPLLILDDLGAHSSTPWAQEKLFQLLNHRYNAQLPTVVTTNQRLEELDPRLRSRLQEADLVNQVAIAAPDFRVERKSGQSDLSTLALHRDQRFDTFDAQRSDLTSTGQAELRRALLQCKAYADDPTGWLILAGGNGAGKTHLAAAIANQYVENTRTDVMFVVVPDLLDHLRAAFSPQSGTSYDRRFDEVKRASLLVLDDWGTQSATPWAREKLFQLLNYRYAALLPTVLSTSLEEEEIEPWLLTRIKDIHRCQRCNLSATSYPGSRSQQEAWKGKTRKRR